MTRLGLRIFIGTANLGHALPDPASLSAWLPRHGEMHNLVRSDVKSPSFDGVDPDGKIEVVAVGFQESVPGSNVLTATGLTAKLTGTTVKERNIFRKAFGSLGKPADDLHKKVDEMIASGVKGSQAEIGGTRELKKMVTRHLGEDYVLMAQYQRGEMVFYLSVRSDLKAISSVTEVVAENCGIGAIMANKGGIATYLTVGSTRLSFLSVHLAAGEGALQYEERNANIGEILRGTNDPNLSAHHAFVLGDLNYRFSLPPRPDGAEVPKEETMLVCRSLIARKDWAAMSQHDELQRALREKRVLVGFETPPLLTFPTFKMERREGFHYVDQRVPSYTDRILWKSVEETRNVEALVYEPVPEFSTSDHKPVRGLFFLPDRLPLELDPEKTALHISLTHAKCEGLKPASDLMRGEIDTFLEFRCEPPSIENKFRAGRRRTDTVRTSGCPTWPGSGIRFRIDVSSGERIHGAYLYVHCVNESAIAADPRLGTAVIDLEHLVRKSLGVPEWNCSVERRLLRSGKEVGKLFCSMEISWVKSQC